ncbi:recombination protein RecR [Candidatus Uhrbacteria bacterium]|nr:recombination protein RecR [Candidatus Uhrbacteria bacterium]
MPKFPEPIERLMAELGRLPGVGPKTAERYAFTLLKRTPNERDRLAKAIVEAGNTLLTCSTCRNWTVSDPCPICSDPHRNRQTVCVVASEPDLLAIEHTGEYHGLYHILGGTLSAADGVSPNDLTVNDLLARIRKDPPREIILAIDHTVEGETTILYLARLLLPTGIRITRLARGLPIGSEIGYADEITLTDALRGRRETPTPNTAEK